MRRWQRHAAPAALALVCALVYTSAPAARAALSRETGAHVHWYKNARGNLTGLWKYDQELLCRSARVHGSMQKRATGSANPALEHHMNTEVADLFWFEGIPIYAPTKYLISQKHKFIFVRQPKSSSTAIIDAIQRTFCAAEKCTPEEFRPLPSVIGMDDIWREYFVFTWVRNPFSRLVSAYKMMTSKYLFLREGADGMVVGGPCGVPFLKFSQNSNTLRADCQERGCCVYIPSYKQWIPWFIAAHINDQAHAVFVGDDTSMVDFIGRTEEIDADWEELLRIYNARMGTDHKPMRFELVNQADDTSNATATTERCAGFDALSAFLNETTTWNIAQQYARDLVLFGFLEDSPPAAPPMTYVIGD